MRRRIFLATERRELAVRERGPRPCTTDSRRHLDGDGRGSRIRAPSWSPGRGGLKPVAGARKHPPPPRARVGAPRRPAAASL